MDGSTCSLENAMDQDQIDRVAGLRGGDPDVVDRLIEQYQHRLFRYLLAITGNRATAEDLFQDTWLRVLERGGQYRPQWKFETWLFSIARHLAIDLARRKKAGSLDELMDPEEGRSFEPADPGPSPFQHALTGEQGDRIGRALARLAPFYREVLVLRFQEDLSIAEIAGIVHATVSTTKSRLYRGLDGLRRTLEVGHDR